MKIECVQCHGLVDVKEADITLKICDEGLLGNSIVIDMVCSVCDLQTRACLPLSKCSIKGWKEVYRTDWIETGERNERN